MNTTAIICEYNPLTNGHLKHIELARKETSADTIFAIMSGSFSQRGDPCIADKYQRAEIAVRLGVDIVCELPTIFAISPADNFAYGAINCISSFPGVQYISFGSECGDANLLTALANILYDEPTELSALIKENLANGLAFPKARSVAADTYLSSKPQFANLIGLLEYPNNVLGISYILAIKKLGLSIKIHTIKRDNNYNSLECNASSSSSAIREAMRIGNINKIIDSVPMETYNLLTTLNNQVSFGDLILFKIKSTSGHVIEKIYDVSGGIHNRIKMASIDASTYEKLLESAKTKSITMARIKRICLYTLFDITQEMYETALTLPPYLHILALNKFRKDILKELSITCPNLLLRYSDINKVDKRLRYLIKLDFNAQGTLNIINKSSCYNKSMLLI